MLNETEEVAFRLFTADTGNASRLEWNVFGNRDKYERMARAAINYLRSFEGTVSGEPYAGLPPHLQPRTLPRT